MTKQCYKKIAEQICILQNAEEIGFLALIFQKCFSISALFHNFASNINKFTH